ncbi:MAG: hypothetical protein JXQ87_11905 [Bacteroidia bacterium]
MNFSRFYKKIIAIFIIISFAQISACREDVEDPEEQKKIILLDDARVYLPGEICTLLSFQDYYAHENFTGRFIEASIDQKVFFDQESTRYHFIVPELEPGENTLEIPTPWTEDQIIFITMNIGSYEKIDNPDIIIDEFKNLLDSSFIKIQNAENLGYDRNEENLEACALMVDEFSKSLKSLTQIEAKQLSYFIQSNQLLNWQVEYVELVDSFQTNKKDDDSDASKKLWENAEKIPRDVARLTLLISGFSKLMIMPEGFFTKAAALADAALIGIQLYFLFDHIDKVLNLAGVYEKFDKIFRSKKDLEILLLKNKPTPLNCRINHRTIQPSDIEHKSLTIRITLDAILKVDQMVTSFKNSLERGKSIFTGKKPEIIREGNNWVSNTKAFTVNPSYFSVSEKSDPKVELILTAKEDRLMLEAIGFTEGFRFKLNYKHPKLKYEISEWITVGVGIPPRISAIEISDVKRKTAIAKGTVIDDFGDPITACGVVWSRTNNEPTIENSNVAYSNVEIGDFEVKMNLKPYHKKIIAVRAFATNSSGTTYGELKYFYSEKYGVPEITITAKRTTRSSALITVNITDSAGSYSGGLLYDTSPIDSFSLDTDTGYYDSKDPTTNHWRFGVGGRWPYLTLNTTYYIRYYLKNDKAGNFSNEIEFKTGSCTDNVLGCTGPAGGTIVYVNEIEKWALESAPKNIGKLAFGCEETTTDVIFGDIGKGMGNCTKIVNSCSSDAPIAIESCLNYSAGGYSDWYLPNRNEFAELIKLENRYKINLINWDEFYWVSEQHGKGTNSVSTAYTYRIDSRPGSLSSSGLATKTTKYWVHPFRKYSW